MPLSTRKPSNAPALKSAARRTSFLPLLLPACGSRGPPVWSPQASSFWVTMPASPNGSPLRVSDPAPVCWASVTSLPWALASAYRKSIRPGGTCRLTVDMPNGENGTRKELNSPTQSIRRSPPVLAISTSSPAPPTARSSKVVCVSGASLRLASVVRTSSMLSWSLPQPPQAVSRPVPPTIQSLPWSPKSTSSPSDQMPVSTETPSVASLFSSHCRQPVVWPPLKFVQAELVLLAVPFSFSVIRRRGSYSSYR